MVLGSSLCNPLSLGPEKQIHTLTYPPLCLTVGITDCGAFASPFWQRFCDTKQIFQHFINWSIPYVEKLLNLNLPVKSHKMSSPIQRRLWIFQTFSFQEFSQLSVHVLIMNTIIFLYNKTHWRLDFLYLSVQNTYTFWCFDGLCLFHCRFFSAFSFENKKILLDVKHCLTTPCSHEDWECCTLSKKVGTPVQIIFKSWWTSSFKLLIYFMVVDILCISEICTFLV